MLLIHELSEPKRNKAIGVTVKLHRCAGSLSLQTMGELSQIDKARLILIENGSIAVEIEELSRVVKVLQVSTHNFLLIAERIAEKLESLKRNSCL